MKLHLWYLIKRWEKVWVEPTSDLSFVERHTMNSSDMDWKIAASCSNHEIYTFRKKSTYLIHTDLEENGDMEILLRRQVHYFVELRRLEKTLICSCHVSISLNRFFTLSEYL